MPDRPRLLIVIATFNEIENLPLLVDEIRRYAAEAEILVIDDNSPDGTGQWCEQRAETDPRLHVLRRSGRLGLGSAIIAGLRYALDRPFDLVLCMDADFSHHPRHIPQLLAGMARSDSGPGADVMIGSRYVAGGGIVGWPLRRRWMSRLINLYARWWLGLTPRDCSGDFRCLRAAVLRRIDLSAVRSTGYSFFEEFLWHLQRAGARIEETPILFEDRRRGNSKINLCEAFRALGFLFWLGLRARTGLVTTGGITGQQASTPDPEADGSTGGPPEVAAGSRDEATP